GAGEAGHETPPSRHLDWGTLAGRAGEPGSSQGGGARRVRGWAPPRLPSLTPAATAPRDSAGADFFRNTAPAAHPDYPRDDYDGGRGQAPELLPRLLPPSGQARNA